MNKFVIYMCDVCGKTDENIDAIKECECNHLGITTDDLAIWSELRETARRTSVASSITHNNEAEAEFNAAIERLLHFEKEHNLQHRHFPRSFQYMI